MKSDGIDILGLGVAGYLSYGSPKQSNTRIAGVYRMVSCMHILCTTAGYATRGFVIFAYGSAGKYIGGSLVVWSSIE